MESILTPLSVKDPTETSSESRQTSVQNEISAKSGTFETYFPSSHQLPIQQTSQGHILEEPETNRNNSKSDKNGELDTNQYSSHSLVEQSAPVLLALKSPTRLQSTAIASVESTLSDSTQTISKSTASKSTASKSADIEDIENESEEQYDDQNAVIPALISMKAAQKQASQVPSETTRSKMKSPKPFDNMASLSVKDTIQLPNMIPEHTFKQNTYLQIPKELEGIDKNRPTVPKLDFSTLKSPAQSPLSSPKPSPKRPQFSFAAWRKRYMQFNNNDKSRVMEQLRALDKCATGYIPNNDFIEHVLSTGFKTTRKELLQVVRLFDPNYEGRMDYCRFISCLRSIPGPNEDEEFNIMAAKWAKAGPRYQVESTDPEYPVSVLYKIA